MVRIGVRVNVLRDASDRTMQQIEKKLREGAAISTQEVAEWGKSYARLIAPHDTGHLISNIRVEKVDGGGARVVARNPKANRSSKGNTPNFNLVTWMHDTNGGRTSNYHAVRNPFSGDFYMVPGNKGPHITSGDPRFMFTTADAMRSKFPNTVRRRLNKIIVRENAR